MLNNDKYFNYMSSPENKNIKIKIPKSLNKYM